MTVFLHLKNGAFNSGREKVTSQIFNLTFEQHRAHHTPLFGSCSCVKREFGSRVLVAQSSSLAKSFNTGLTRDFRSIASWLSVGLCCSAFHHDFQLMIFIKAFISSNITKESVKNHLLAKRSRPLVFLYQVFALISHEREKTKDLPTRVIMKKGTGGPWKV